MVEPKSDFSVASAAHERLKYKFLQTGQDQALLVMREVQQFLRRFTK